MKKLLAGTAVVLALANPANAFEYYDSSSTAYQSASPSQRLFMDGNSLCYIVEYLNKLDPENTTNNVIGFYVGRNLEAKQRGEYLQKGEPFLNEERIAIYKEALYQCPDVLRP